MAERRMFSKTIIDSDAFLEMPVSTQALYFHLSMRADDDGFINSPKKICRMVGARDDDMDVLLAKKFILFFDSGVIVIKHWRIHNYIQRDRYKPTNYIDEKSQLVVSDNNSYSMNTKCIQPVSSMDTECTQDVSNSRPICTPRLGKVSLELGKVSLENDAHDAPTTPKKRQAKVYAEKPDDVNDQTWNEWLTIRKTKPTPLVVMENRSQAAKAGMTLEQAITYAITKSWQSFDFGWWQNREGKSGKQSQNSMPDFDSWDKPLGYQASRDNGNVIEGVVMQ